MNEFEIIGSGAPVSYNYMNRAAAMVSPSEVHLSNNRIAGFFRRYFLQRLISRYDLTLPANWAKDYVYYTLFTWGYMAVVNTSKFGIIPQGASLSGFDVFYRPTNAVITNPLLKGILRPEIGKQTELIRLMPDYGSPMDIISYFADMCALTAETAGMNVQNSKLSYVFASKNKAFAETFKKMFDDVQKGEPAVFVDKDLFNEDGSATWDTFTQDLRSNYIAGDMLQDLRKWMDAFDTFIGINNANTEKKERMLTDEVNANNEEVYSLASLWLETLTESMQKVRDMFGYSEAELNVKFRDFEGGENNDSFDLRTE